jgi:tetratricopeptide (TPR) repeat protein
MPKQLYKFNPSLAVPQVLQKTLVGREEEVLRILRKIKECSEGTSLRHFLIVGPRGIGKTYLILLVYYTIKGKITWNGEYANLERSWIPIRFAEEEYRVATLTEFLSRVLQELKNEVPNGQEVAAPGNSSGSRLLQQGDTEELLGRLLRVRQTSGKRFLLLVDNFHQILERFTVEDRGRLRDILMTKDLFLLIGTVPTLFGQITSYEEPFYNFFENIWLNELDAEQGVKLIYKWWDQEDRKDFQERSAELGPRINALVHLTGGNPRLILSLYPIITEANVSEVEETFIALLDELTPYFQSKMNELSEQQARIVDTMALMEGPSTPTRIAGEASLEVSKVTSQLNRMQRSGYVVVLKERGERKTLYDIKERLFRLWRQMRVEAGKRYLSFLVMVIKVWYTEEELAQQFEKVSSELERALEQKKEEKAREALKHLWYIREASPQYLSSAISYTRVYGLIQVRDLEAAEADIELLLRERRERQDKEELAEIHWLRAYLRHEAGRKEDEIEALRAYLKLRPDIYEAWNNMGIAYADLGRHEEAIEAYRKATEIDSSRHEAWGNLGNLYAQMTAYQAAAEAYQRFIELKPDDLIGSRNLAHVYLYLGQDEQALEVAKKAVEIRPNDADGWDALGHAYSHLKDYQAAIEALSRAIELSPQEPLYYSNRSHDFESMHKLSEAVQDSEKAFRLAEEAKEGELAGYVATDLVRLYLLCSAKRAISGKVTPAEKYLRKALQYAQLAAVEETRTQELATAYFNGLLQKKKAEFLRTALEVVEEAKLSSLEQLLRFYRISLQYLETKDKAILNQLFPELRELVQSLDQK